MIHIATHWWADPALFLARALVGVGATNQAARLATFVLQRGVTTLIVRDPVHPRLPSFPQSYPAAAFQPGFRLIH